MDENQRQAAFFSALSTEHFVLQTAAATTVNEAAARASIYIMSVSASLVAIGFASQSRDAFGPFVASVIPALFLLGLITVARLVDINGEFLQCFARMARVRRYYRALTPEAGEFFAESVDASSIPSLQLGPRIAFLTTTSSMVAFINNVVAGAGMALLARRLLGSSHTLVAVLIGVTGALILTAAYLAYQKWRFTMFGAVVPGRERK